MSPSVLIGSVLVAGLVVFLVGAAAWRLEYQQALEESLPLIHADRRRRAWIHLWMIPALFLTSAGLFALPTSVGDDASLALVRLAAVIYVIGAVCWVVSLLFRLTVVPWAAERTVLTGQVPDGFAALDHWAGSLYAVHMVSAYVAFAVLGVGLLSDGALGPWVGWVGIGSGVSLLIGFVATRFEGPFNPPFLAHAYTGVVGVVLLIS